MDQITIARIALLHPKLRIEATNIYQECVKALTGKYTLRFSQTLRSHEEQQKLYNQGRTQPGKIVTWAKAGQSYHNYGLAIDICLITKDFKNISWNINQDSDKDTIADWIECVNVFEKYNWEWGGRWKYPKTDNPHFQKTYNKSTKELSTIAKLNNSNYPLIS